jgi:hypothetical protein
MPFRWLSDALEKPYRNQADQKLKDFEKIGIFHQKMVKITQFRGKMIKNYTEFLKMKFLTFRGYISIFYLL